ncbi:MAG TPA: MFS transporter [Actinobacteria bacterium]|nr:MFS transporter [Actinomycetota bacterium]
MNRPAWWGGRRHVTATIAAFVVLASLDNAALATIPAMIKPLEAGVGASPSSLGVLVGAQVLVAAASAVGWGYAGDRWPRKRLLVLGTLAWSLPVIASAAVRSFPAFAAWQLLAGLGLGAIASVGFSVVSDFVAPRRRGLAMSFWGLSQGIGGWVGLLVASQLGADDFRRPLLLVGVVGLGAAVVYLLAFDAPRGYREPELAELFAAGGTYEHRIATADLPRLLRVPTNLWLVLQGLTAQIAYGSLVWVPLLYQEKVIAEGYSAATGTKVGGLFSALFLTGALFSILAGHVGDRLQRRTLRGRALVSAVGILGAVPCFLVFFWLPLEGLEVTDGASTVVLAREVLVAVATNPWVAGAFLSSIVALALTSADAPNWFALVSDVNLPEHRGTVFGVGNLVNGIGRAAGTALTGSVAGALQRALPPPLNWALGLSAFQAFFLPTGWCYWRASQTAPDDIERVRRILAERGAA